MLIPLGLNFEFEKVTTQLSHPVEICQSTNNPTRKPRGQSVMLRYTTPSGGFHPQIYENVNNKSQLCLFYLKITKKQKFTLSTCILIYKEKKLSYFSTSFELVFFLSFFPAPCPVTFFFPFAHTVCSLSQCLTFPLSCLHTHTYARPHSNRLWAS